MALNWYQSSQVNWGLILKGIRPPQAYCSVDFAPPFDEMLEFVQGKEDWCKEDLYSHFAPSELDGALHAVASLNGSSTDVDWPTILKTTAKKWELGEQFEKTGKALKRGDSPDVLNLRSDLISLAENQTLGARRMSEIDLSAVEHLQLSGWKELDSTFGGMPKTGPMVIYGTMGTGKSFLTSKVVNEFLHHYTDREAGVYSLEMADDRYADRALEMYPSIKDVMDRIWVSGKARNINDIIAEASVKEFDLVVIDSVDYLPEKETSASVMDMIWKAIVRMGRLLEIPIIVTAQPNRNSKWNSKTSFLEKYDIAWSGSAEDAAEQLIAVQYLEDTTNFTDERFPVFENAYYMISWKQRGGWPAQKGPGAIVFKDHKYDKEDNIILWDGSIYQNLLWRPGAAKAKIGKPSSRKKVTDED